MVPGAATAGLVAPIMSRTICQVSSGPSTTRSMTGRAGDEAQQVLVERLALMLRVVLRCGCGVDGPQLGRHQAEALAFQAPDDLAHQACSTASGLQMTRVRFTSAAG